MYLENMLSKRSQTQNITILHNFYDVFRIDKSIEIECRLIAVHELDDTQGVAANMYGAAFDTVEMRLLFEE